MEGGYIFLHRKVREHWIWDNAEYFKWWMDLLMMANHQPKKIMLNGNPKIIERGEHHTSETKLEKRWFASRKSIDNFLKLLEKDGMIEIKKSRQTGTTIKVCNYHIYQPFFDNDSTSKEHRENNDSTSKEHKQEPKETKNLKKEEADASSATVGGAPVEPSPIPYAEIMELYNETCVSLPKIRIIDGERKTTVSERFDTYGDIGAFKTLFEKAEASRFLKGENERKWKADFDWLTDADNMAKTLEGKYDRENDPLPKQDGMRVEYETFDLNTFAEKAAKAGMRYDGQEAKPQKN